MHKMSEDFFVCVFSLVTLTDILHSVSELFMGVEQLESSMEKNAIMLLSVLLCSCH